MVGPRRASIPCRFVEVMSAYVTGADVIEARLRGVYRWTEKNEAQVLVPSAPLGYAVR